MQSLFIAKFYQQFTSLNSINCILFTIKLVKLGS